MSVYDDLVKIALSEFNDIIGSARIFDGKLRLFLIQVLTAAA